LIASQLTGIGDLISYCRRLKLCSDYYIKGYDRLDESVQNMVGMMAMAGGFIDEMALLLLEDDRVMVQVDELAECVSAYVSNLGALPDAVFLILSSLTKWSVQEFRSRALAATNTAVCFVALKLFGDLHKLPWSLCDGDLLQALRTLKEQSEPDEAVASQLWRLLASGYPVETLVLILVAIRNLPWGTGGVEQQHAAAAQIHRMHPLLQQDQVRCRAMIHFMRSLLSPSSSVKEMSCLAKRQRGLERQVPFRTNGKCMFMREAFQRWHELNEHGKMSNEVKHALVRQTSPNYAALPEDARKAYTDSTASEDTLILLP